MNNTKIDCKMFLNNLLYKTVQNDYFPRLAVHIQLPGQSIVKKVETRIQNSIILSISC